MTHADDRRLYQPYYVDGPYDKRYATTIFPRDPRTGVQVWSGETGYPGDDIYLDFHKKRWPGGHRYWRVTGSKRRHGRQAALLPAAGRRAHPRAHASHFVHLVYEALKPGFNDAIPPILCSPFDAELFGHWWFEGALWLEAVARILHDYDTGIQLITCAEYLDHYPRAGFIAMHEGSWGAEGNNQVWMNPETSWTYTHIYPAETLHPRRLHRRPLARRPPSANASCSSSAANSCSSNPPTGSSSSPPAPRATTPRSASSPTTTSSTTSSSLWLALQRDGSLNDEQLNRLAAIEERDNIFPDIDPGLWSTGSHATHSTPNTNGSPKISPENHSEPAVEAPITDASVSEVHKYVLPIDHGAGDADDPA